MPFFLNPHEGNPRLEEPLGRETVVELEFFSFRCALSTGRSAVVALAIAGTAVDAECVLGRRDFP